jgi:hypothetical protein
MVGSDWRKNNRSPDFPSETSSISAYFHIVALIIGSTPMMQNDMPSTQLGEDLAPAIDVETIVVRMPDYSTHSCPVTRKRYQLNDFSSILVSL